MARIGLQRHRGENNVTVFQTVFRIVHGYLNTGYWKLFAEEHSNIRK